MFRNTHLNPFEWWDVGLKCLAQDDYTHGIMLCVFAWGVPVLTAVLLLNAARNLRSVWRKYAGHTLSWNIQCRVPGRQPPEPCWPEVPGREKLTEVMVQINTPTSSVKMPMLVTQLPEQLQTRKRRRSAAAPAEEEQPKAAPHVYDPDDENSELSW